MLLRHLVLLDLFWNSSALLSPSEPKEPFVKRSLENGTFAAPAPAEKPRFRYWIQDASCDEETVVSDIQSAGAIGAGGVEILPYYSYGGYLPPVFQYVDWDVYGFGQAAWNKLYNAALEAIQQAGMVVDVSLFPGSGGGVPANATDDGLIWDLVPYSMTIGGTGSFNGTIPGWSPSAGTLIALNTAVVISTQNLTVLAQDNFFAVPANVTTQIFTVESDSFSTVATQNVSATGTISLSLPALSGNQSYQLTAFYQRHNLYMTVHPLNYSTNILKNGSFGVDHFSARGAQTVIDFWETNILTDDMKTMLASVGNFLWEDSLETASTINWTPDLPAVFEQMHGYSIYKYLPLITYGNNNINAQASSPGTLHFLTDAADKGMSFVNDYRATLAACYKRYVDALQAWGHSSLGLNTSIQAGYNMPLDASLAMTYPDAPETETIQFQGGAIDSLKQAAGAAVLTGKKILSCEMGGNFFSAFQQHVSQLLFLINRGFAGGVNQNVIHGQAYSGPYPNTTWPGFSPFTYLVSGQWSPREPAWDNGMSEMLHYTGRVQHVLQSGIPKLDVLFYNKASATNSNWAIIYNYTDLVAAGYTYNYASPLIFDFPGIDVTGGILDPSGPAYKALVILSSQNITADAATKLTEYAARGLPIIFVDGAPGVYPEEQQQNATAISAAIQALASSANVHTSTSGRIAQTLAEIGVKPRTMITGGADNIYPVWREHDSDAIDYLFLYSDLVAANGTITVATTKVPHILDAWTGETKPLLTYTNTSGSIEIPLNLAANQTVLYAFADNIADVATPSISLTNTSSNVIEVVYSCSSEIVAHVINDGETAQVLTSSGKSYAATTSNLDKPFTINDWSLTVEHWDPPADLYDLSVIAVKTNTTQQVTSPLKSWLELPGLNQTAGLGFYSSNFTWQSGGNSSGAYLSIERIVNTARLYINGQQTRPLDYTNGIVDITPYLVDGLNEVMIQTSSCLGNRMFSIFDQVQTAGSNYFELLLGTIANITYIDEGLIGTVSIIPYTTLLISE